MILWYHHVDVSSFYDRLMCQMVCLVSFLAFSTHLSVCFTCVLLFRLFPSIFITIYARLGEAAAAAERKKTLHLFFVSLFRIQFYVLKLVSFVCMPGRFMLSISFPTCLRLGLHRLMQDDEYQ